MTITLEHTTFESLQVPVTVSADPVANPPEFAILPCSHTPTELSWVNGSWVGSWSSALLPIPAQTPILGGINSGAQIELGSGDWFVWMRIAVGTENIVRKLDLLRMRGGVEGGGSGSDETVSTIVFDDSPFTVPAGIDAVLVDASGGAVIVQLALTSTRIGEIIQIKKTDGSPNTVTVLPAGAEMIEGSPSVVLTVEGEAVSLLADSDASSWWIV